MLLLQRFDKNENRKEKSTAGINAILLPSVLGMLLCAICLVGNTWAWFTASQEAQAQTLQAASYDIAIQIVKISDDEGAPADDEGTPADGEGAPADDEGTPADDEGTPADGEGTPADGEGDGAATTANITLSGEENTATLAKGTYTVTLTASGDASTGYCIVKLGGREWLTQQFPSLLYPAHSMTFTLVMEKEADVSFTASWGTSSVEDDMRIQNDGVLTYPAVETDAEKLVGADAQTDAVTGADDGVDADAQTEEVESSAETEEVEASAGAEEAGETELLHTVAAGETLFSIATHYGITAEELQAYNGIEDPTLMLVGTVLRIPQGENGTTESDDVTDSDASTDANAAADAEEAEASVETGEAEASAGAEEETQSSAETGEAEASAGAEEETQSSAETGEAEASAGAEEAGETELLHTVAAGETLFSIATHYGITAEELQAYNGIEDPTLMLVGTVLRIPQGENGTTESDDVTDSDASTDANAAADAEEA